MVLRIKVFLFCLLQADFSFLLHCSNFQKIYALEFNINHILQMIPRLQKSNALSSQQRLLDRSKQIAKKRTAGIDFFAPQAVQLKDQDQIQEYDKLLTQVQTQTQYQKKQQLQQKQKVAELQQKTIVQIVNLQKKIQKIQQTLNDPLSVLQQARKQAYSTQKQKDEQQQKLKVKQGENIQVKQKQVQLKERQQQKKKEFFEDTGIQWKRSNYVVILDHMLDQMSKYFNVDQLRNKYRSQYNGSKKRLYDKKQLLARLKVVYSKYLIFKNYLPQFQYKIGVIDSQQRIIQQKPNKWFKNYLRKKLKLNDDDPLFIKMTSDPLIQKKEIQRRIQQLQKKKTEIRDNFEKLSRRSQRLRLQRIKQLQQLSNQKSRLYEDQKKVLVFIIDQAQKQINQMTKNIQTTKQQFKQVYDNLIAQNTQTRQKLIKQQKQYQQKISSLSKKIEQQNNLINQQNEYILQQKKLIQEKDYKMSKQQQQIHLLRIQNKALRQQLQKQRQSKLQIQQQAYNIFKSQKQQNEKLMFQKEQQLKQSQQKDLQLRNQLLTQKILQKQQYEKQLQDLTINYQNHLSHIENMVNAQLTKKQYQSQTKFNDKLFKMKQQFVAENQKIMKYLQGKQKQFEQYRANAQKYILQKAQSHALQIELLNKKLEQNKQLSQTQKKQFQQKKKQLQLEIQQLNKKHQEQKKATKRVLDTNKKQIQQITRDLKKQSDLNIQKLLKKQQELVQFKQQKQQQVNQLLIKIGKLTEQAVQAQKKARQAVLEKKKAQQIAQKAEQQKKKAQQIAQKAEQQKKKAAQDLANIQDMLKKYKDNKTFITAFKRWTIKDVTTVRQCFKLFDQQKWIATTRGISYKIENALKVGEVFKYWQQILKNNDFPKQKVEKRIQGTQIVMILDIYKQKKYFGLRQSYYKNGQMLPTRRGFNISQKDIKFFFSSIAVPEKISNIENHQEYAQFQHKNH